MSKLDVSGFRNNGQWPDGAMRPRRIVREHRPMMNAFWRPMDWWSMMYRRGVAHAYAAGMGGTVTPGKDILGSHSKDDMAWRAYWNGSRQGVAMPGAGEHEAD